MDVYKRQFPVVGKPVKVTYRVVCTGKASPEGLAIKDSLFGSIPVQLSVPPLAVYFSPTHLMATM